MSPDKIALLMAYQFPPETLLLRASLSQQVKCNPIDNPVPLGGVAEVGFSTPNTTSQYQAIRMKTLRGTRDYSRSRKRPHGTISC
jgi:hypothetical protein